LDAAHLKNKHGRNILVKTFESQSNWSLQIIKAIKSVAKSIKLLGSISIQMKDRIF
jgi:hypothetical protein